MTEKDGTGENNENNENNENTVKLTTGPDYLTKRAEQVQANQVNPMLIKDNLEKFLLIADHINAQNTQFGHNYLNKKYNPIYNLFSKDGDQDYATKTNSRFALTFGTLFGNSTAIEMFREAREYVKEYQEHKKESPNATESIQEFIEKKIYERLEVDNKLNKDNLIRALHNKSGAYWNKLKEKQESKGIQASYVNNFPIQEGKTSEHIFKLLKLMKKHDERRQQLCQKLWDLEEAEAKAKANAANTEKEPEQEPINKEVQENTSSEESQTDTEQVSKQESEQKPKDDKEWLKKYDRYNALDRNKFLENKVPRGKNKGSVEKKSDEKKQEPDNLEKQEASDDFKEKFDQCYKEVVKELMNRFAKDAKDANPITSLTIEPQKDLTSQNPVTGVNIYPTNNDGENKVTFDNLNSLFDYENPPTMQKLQAKGVTNPTPEQVLEALMDNLLKSSVNSTLDINGLMDALGVVEQEYQKNVGNDIIERYINSKDSSLKLDGYELKASEDFLNFVEGKVDEEKFQNILDEFEGERLLESNNMIKEEFSTDKDKFFKLEVFSVVKDLNARGANINSFEDLKNHEKVQEILQHKDDNPNVIKRKFKEDGFFERIRNLRENISNGSQDIKDKYDAAAQKIQHLRQADRNNPNKQPTTIPTTQPMPEKGDSAGAKNTQEYTTPNSTPNSTHG